MERIHLSRRIPEDVSKLAVVSLQLTVAVKPVGGATTPTVHAELDSYLALAGRVFVMGLRSKPNAGQTQLPKKDGLEE